MRLSELPPGGRGRVARIDCAGALGARLEDLGLCPGVEVRCLHWAPAGSPRAYTIRGAAIALRIEDADNIRLLEEQP